MTCLAKELGRFRTSLLSLFFCFFGFHPVWADDTEIFFSPVSGSQSQPNVLLVLDASASMLNRDGGSTTRQHRMNEAVVRVLNQISNVNIGVMRYSNRDSGGRVLYPVTDIETRLCDGTPCASPVGFNGSVTTARQDILDVITNMVMQFDTPTVGALLEAENYYSGNAVGYGKKRLWLPCEDRSAVEAEKCLKDVRIDGVRQRFTREEGRLGSVSHPNSYTGGQLINRPAVCDEDPTDPACFEEEITGNAVYTSPILNECQSNHILLMADGGASFDAATEAARRRFGSCGSTELNTTRGECGIEVVEYMANNDLRSDLDGIQNVTTHTVGFNLDSPWLERLASGNIGDAGAGGYYTADSTDELVETLVDIISNVQKTATTFVAPGITVDQFSRLSHRSDTYLALFEAANTPQWPGNMKRYDLLSGALFDANDPARRAVNSITGRFVPDSRSYWSTVNDGHSILVGGAASRLPDYSNRKAVTYNGSEDSLFHHTNEVSTDNVENLTSVSAVAITNLASRGVATQSTTAFGGAAGRAKDSNTGGEWARGSISHTAPDSGQPWWQLDLLESFSINDINIFGRIDDCCTHRLKDVRVYVSDTPFGNASNEDLQANPNIWQRFHPGEIDQASRPYTVSPNVTGRYVRVALDDPNEPLSLAEVQVIGGRDNDVEIARLSNLVEWVRGKDVKDQDEDNVTNETRHYIGDPLHSSPHIVNYGGTEEDPDSVVFVGTNEGFLHAFSSQTGDEEFAFMPKELIPNLEILYENSTSADKVYGMDGNITSWINDLNQNGSVDDGTEEHAYLYAGMRRGGSSYYALDVTDRDDPKFLFNIPQVDPTAYAELGQTWSEPTVASIKVGSDIKKVLIFAGGYDESQDDKTTYSSDTSGRAIFIADAEDGSLIWSGQPTAKAGLPIKSFPDMQYSIPSDINVVDLESDGLASQFYVGDMGGQLWRFDINNGNTGTDLVDGGVIAELGDQTQSGARRFFHAPDIVLTKYDGKVVLSIGIGSGYQAHPLDTVIDDRYYQIRYPREDTGNYGIQKDPDDPSRGYRAITEQDIFDTTDNLIGQGTEDQIDAAQLSLSENQGWLIRMERDGEKILGASATLDGVVRFISYVPASNTIDNRCLPNTGQSTYWRVGLGDGAPPEDENSDGTITKEDRGSEVPGGGIAPPVTTVFVPDKTTGDVVPTDVSGINVLNQGTNVNTVQRWYWAEIPE